MPMLFCMTVCLPLCQTVCHVVGVVMMVSCGVCDDTFLSCLRAMKICCFLPENVFSDLVLWFSGCGFECFVV